MLGTRTRMAWGALEEGIGRTFYDWREVFQRPDDDIKQLMKGYKGGTTMYTEIKNVIGLHSGQISEQRIEGWFGLFSSLNVILGAKAVLKDNSNIFFNVTQEGRLEWIPRQDDVMQQAFSKRVRVVVHVNSQWHLDLDPNKFKPEWDVWIFGKCPLVRLQWDPGDYVWKDPLNNQQELSFFQYNTKLGRHIMMASKRSLVSAEGFWISQGIEIAYIHEFWKCFWEVEQARKITMFHWLLMHRAVPVKEWLRLPNECSVCTDCGLASESLRHCLWDCLHAKLVWQRMLRIFQFRNICINVSWGSAVWMTLRDYAFSYDATFGNTKAIDITYNRIRDIPVSALRSNTEDRLQTELWILLSNATLWYLWTARCERRYQKIHVPHEEVVKSVWQEMILTLKARLDSIKGDSDTAAAKRVAFHTLWQKMGFYVRDTERSYIKWMHVVPKWLFPPSHRGSRR